MYNEEFQFFNHSTFHKNLQKCLPFSLSSCTNQTNFGCTDLKFHRFNYTYTLQHERSCFVGVCLKCLTVGLLICTLISENQGLKKSRSVSNLRKISGPAHLDFFSVCHPDFFSRKKSRFAGPEIFLRFEADLDFSRP